MNQQSSKDQKPADTMSLDYQFAKLGDTSTAKSECLVQVDFGDIHGVLTLTTIGDDCIRSLEQIRKQVLDMVTHIDEEIAIIKNKYAEDEVEAIGFRVECDDEDDDENSLF